MVKLMAKEKLPKLFRRKWLNNDKGSAYIIVDASVEKHWDKKYPEDRSVDAGIEIKDCYKQSNLEFNYYDEQDYQRRLKKIRLYIETLEELEAFMKANPPINNHSKKKKKNKEVDPISIKDTEGELPITTEAVNDLPAKKSEVIEATATLTFAPVKLINETTECKTT